MVVRGAGGVRYPDGTYRPHEVVRRDALSAFLFRLAEHQGLVPFSPTTQQFPDVPPSHVFFDEIGWMAFEDIATGFPDGTFRPDAPVTRDAMAAFLHRYWKAQGPAALRDVDRTYPDPGFADVPPSHPFHAEIAWLAALGITVGNPDGTFGPAEPVTRGSMAAFVRRLDERLEPQSFVVDVATDGGDAVVGDGACEVTVGEGDCSLRAAIDEANASFADDTIAIAAGVDPVLSIAGHNDDTNAKGDLDVLEPVTLEGEGATIDAAGLDRVLHLSLPDDAPQPPRATTLDGVTLTGGALHDDEEVEGGAGLRVDWVDLSLVDVTVAGNDASALDSPAFGLGSGVQLEDSLLHAERLAVVDNVGADDAGIWLEFGTAELTQSRIADNSGRGVVAFDGDVTLAESVVSGHQGTAVVADVVTLDHSAVVDNGGGVLADDLADVRQSTVDNTGSAVIAGDFTVVGSTLVTRLEGVATVDDFDGTGSELAGTIVAGPAGSDRCAGEPIDSKGWNIAIDDSCDLDATGDQPSTDPLLGALGDHGGPTPTRVPAAESPAVDAIPVGTAGLCNASTPTDQRGEPRPSGDACDIGAVERQETD